MPCVGIVELSLAKITYVKPDDLIFGTIVIVLITQPFDRYGFGFFIIR